MMTHGVASMSRYKQFSLLVWTPSSPVTLNARTERREGKGGPFRLTTCLKIVLRVEGTPL